MDMDGVTTVLSLVYMLNDEKNKCKRFSVRRLLEGFSNKQGKKRTLNDFMRKSGTLGSTKRTAVSGRPFLFYFLFYQVEWRRS